MNIVRVLNPLLILVALVATPVASSAQGEGTLGRAYGAVLAEFADVLGDQPMMAPVPIDRDPASRTFFPSGGGVDFNQVVAEIGNGARPYEEAFACTDYCVLGEGVGATVSFVQLTSGPGVTRYGATVRYDAGGDAPAPAIVWYEVEVSPGPDTSMTTDVRVVAQS